MKASPIAQYLEQKSRGRTGRMAARRAARRAPRAAPPATLAAGRAPSVFRAPRRACAARTARAPKTRSRAAAIGRRAAAAPRRPRCSVRARSPPPAARRHREAARRGLSSRRAGRSRRGARRSGDARAMERAELQKRAVVERLDFQMNEYAKLAESIAPGLTEIERRIADVGRADPAAVPRPGGLARRSSRISPRTSPGCDRGGHPPADEDPRPRAAAERAEGAARAARGRGRICRRRTGIEITVEAQHTTIATELAPWAELIAKLSERG